MKKSSSFKLRAVAAAAATLLVCTSAFAAYTTYQPVKIAEYTQQTSGGVLWSQLLIQTTDGVSYVANPGAPVGQGAPGCGITPATPETAKVWLSMAQSSLLSGRNVRIFYTQCSGWNWITGIDLGP